MEECAQKLFKNKGYLTMLIGIFNNIVGIAIKVAKKLNLVFEHHIKILNRES